MKIRVSRVLGTFLAIAFVQVAAAQSTIELKSSVKLTPGAAVKLAQIATLTGDEATALAGTVIIPEGQATRAKIALKDVRAVLGQSKGINWGRITLRGSVCTLIAPEPVKAAPKPVAAPAQPAPVDPNSVRRAIADRIAHIVQAESADLRLTFNDDDDEILNLSTTGRTLEIKSNAASDKLPLALNLYEGERIVASKTIRVGVLVRRTVVIAGALKNRGDELAEGDVTVDQQWVGPNLRPAPPEAVINAAAQGRITTGQIIGVGDVAAPMIVAKGEQVMVSCVSGTIVLTTKARAMANGRVGDVIKFQGLEDKRTFTARMSGRGRAVVTAEPNEPVQVASENKP